MTSNFNNIGCNPNKAIAFTRTNSKREKSITISNTPENKDYINMLKKAGFHQI